ncbi:hypothetical protein WHL19_14490, partial [Staphylococcus aureus]|uniref:hypothetical protein n=1 Tax=Staphylococcus aureus TaxID=1280 RepID=UPI0039BEB111
YLGSKKGEISTSCEKLFAGEAITEAETKEAALAWVPDAMRFDAVGTAELVEDTGPGDDDSGTGSVDHDPSGDEVNDDADDTGDTDADAGAVNDENELVAAE